MIVQTYYISTGAKNAMYTLRVSRSGALVGTVFDSYVCNLAASQEAAEEKAARHVEALRERIKESDNFKIVFDLYADEVINKRRGKLSVRDTRNLELIEKGVFPFGLHEGKGIAMAPDSYLLFFADKTKEELDAVMAALAAACMGVALEKGLIAKRDAIRSERAAQDAISRHIGKVGERRDFTGELVSAFEKNRGEPDSYFINRVRCGDDIVIYIGQKALGEVGTTITFRATIKKHEEYNGGHSTHVNRPVIGNL